MAKKRKRRSILRSKFYRAYFVVVILCLISIAIGAHWLNGLLADYESAQPAHAAEAAARLFENADYETLYAYDTSAANLAGGDRDYYVQNMRTLAQGKSVSWSETYSPNDSEKRYKVLLDGEKFAEIALVPSGQTTRHGNLLWSLGSVTTYVTMGEQEVESAPEPTATPEPEPTVPTGIPCRVTVPAGYAVSVDGATLTEENATMASVSSAAEGLLPEGIPCPTLTEYTFYSQSGAPQVVVTDANGNLQPLNAESENAWICSLPENAELKAQVEEAVVEVAKRLAGCAAKSVSKDAMLTYCAKNSPARENIKNFEDLGTRLRNKGTYENIQTSNYYMYSEDCFSCHVSFTYTTRLSADVVRSYDTVFTLYFVKQGNSGKLYNFTLY